MTPAVLGATVRVDWLPWAAHPEVWLLILSLIGLYVYAARVIGPKVVPEGQPVVTTWQWAWFFGAVGLLWFASDWPLHDVSEQYLYTAHMLQHTLFTLVIPPMFLLAMPTWLARLIIGRPGSRVYGFIRGACRPVVAILVFNGLMLLTHTPAIVNTAVQVAWFHYLVHTVLMFSALALWMPVCGPIREWRMSLPMQMVYLFITSIMPTVPGTWLAISGSVVYSSYDTTHRLWGISALDDQQAAGIFMLLVEGFWLWLVITYIFFLWVRTRVSDWIPERLTEEETAARLAEPRIGRSPLLEPGSPEAEAAAHAAALQATSAPPDAEVQEPSTVSAGGRREDRPPTD